MKYYIGEIGSTGRCFEDLDSFILAIKDLAVACEEKHNDTFEIEVVTEGE